VFSPTAIRAQLDRYGLRYTEYNDDELAEVIARHISEDRIVAVFSGRGEIGPRALGNRSILASPTSPRIRDKVNDAKGRELWRPLCPSVLANSAKAYFHDASTGSRFMLRSLLVRDERAVEIGGVVHVDGTARAQLVDEDTPFGGLLSLVSDMTGSPMVMNTSFNLAGEPIVGRPVDAIRSFFASPLDVLVLERYVITK
jgi:carbamoyltransferase